jgi:hypothetical protein
MHLLKFFLLKTGLYRLLRPFEGLMSKAAAYSEMCNWLRQQPFEVNDFFNPKATHADHYKLFEYATENCKQEPIDYFEFGVDDGETFFWWLQQLKHPDARFFGFDSFEGLPEDWGLLKKGTFSHGGQAPALNDPRAQFVKGLFQDTLYAFLQTYRSEKRKILFLDADLYSSTLFVLTTLAPYLRSGDLILFDEFFAPRHEYKAWVDFQKAYPHLKVQTFASFGNYNFIGMKVL